MIIRNKETKEYIPIPNKYGNSSLDFQTAYLYMARLPESKRDTLEIYDREQDEVIKPIRYVDNDRYLLWLDSKGIDLEDYAMGKIEFNTNVEFLSFVDKYVKDFETNFDKPVLSSQEEFTNYMEYKVLGEIAFNEAVNERGSGYINSSPKMINLLNKYNISEKTSNEDQALYKRISNRWEQGQKFRIVTNYKEEILDKIPDEYLDKYLKVLPDENVDSHELYRDIYRYRQIVDNIEAIESKKDPVKFLINYSENSNFNSGQVLNLEEMEYKTGRAIDEVKERNRIDSEKYGEEFYTYDKLGFTIIIDNGEDFEIFKDNRHDIGDYQSFSEYFDKNYTNEFKAYVKDVLEKSNDEEDEEEEL